MIFKNKCSYETILFILFKIVFDLYYSTIISPIYAYMGVTLLFNKYRYIVVWIIYLIFVFIMSKFRSCIYGIIAKTIFIISTVSALSLYALKDIPTKAFILVVVYWLLLFSSLLLMSKIRISIGKMNSIRINNNYTKNSILELALLIFCIIFVTALSAIYSDFRILTSFRDVYTYRLYMRQVNLPRLIGYFMVFTSKVFLPFLFATYLSKKKYMTSGIVFFLGLLLFSIDGSKTALLVYFVILLIFFVHKKYGNFDRLIICLLLGVIILCVVSALVYRFTGDIMLIGLIHRTLCSPSEISYYYYDFFKSNELLYLRESILRIFFEMPYNIPSTFLLGGLYATKTVENNLNNGLFGDAYANFGVIGILLYPFLFSIVIKTFEYFSKRIDYRIAVSTSIIIVWTVANTSFFTWLITGGVIVYILVFRMNNLKIRR